VPKLYRYTVLYVYTGNAGWADMPRVNV